MSQAPPVPDAPEAIDFDALPDGADEPKQKRSLPVPDTEALQAGAQQVPPLLAAVSIGLILLMVLFGGRLESSLATLSERADAAAQNINDGTTDEAAAGPAVEVDPNREDWKVLADTIAATIGERPPGAPPLPAGSVTDVVAALVISEEGSFGGAYDRDLFPHWTDLDGNGCDARDDTLARDFENERLNGCEVIANTGTAYGAWGGQPTTDPGTLDIDHIVPLGWAWPSGASEWGAPAAGQTSMHEVFANDPANLVAADASVNRGRGAGIPPNWEPSTDVGKCVFIDRFSRVVAAYGLSVTNAEHAALVDLAAFCA